MVKSFLFISNQGHNQDFANGGGNRIYPYDTLPGALRLDRKTFFFGIHLYLAGKCSENIKSAGDRVQFKSGLGG